MNDNKGYLSNKGGKIRVSKIFWEYLSGERDNIMDNESNITFIPGYHSLIFGVLLLHIWLLKEFRRF
jgi:hypothetical protein